MRALRLKDARKLLICDYAASCRRAGFLDYSEAEYECLIEIEPPKTLEKIVTAIAKDREHLHLLCQIRVPLGIALKSRSICSF